MPSAPSSAICSVIEPGPVAADVGHPVGAEHHEVDRVLVERLAGLLVAEPQPGLEVGAAARLQRLDGVHDLVGLAHRRRLEDRRRLVLERHHGDHVVTVQPVGQQRQRRLHQPEPLADVHAAGPVDDQGHVDPRALGLVDLAGGHADPHDLGAVVEARREARLGGDAEVVVGRCGVGVLHGVDPLLDADRLGRRRVALGQQRPADAERPGVDVQREGRERVGEGVDEPAGPGVHERRCRRSGRGSRAAR